jgi:hypothetical protein
MRVAHIGGLENVRSCVLFIGFFRSDHEFVQLVKIFILHKIDFVVLIQSSYLR